MTTMTAGWITRDARSGAVAVLAALILGLLPAPASAATTASAKPGATSKSSDPPPTSAEEFFVRLFLVTCLTNIRTPQQVVALAQAAGMPPIADPYAKMFLEGKKGAVWSASNARWGQYILSLREDGRCGTYAAKLDAAKVATLLRERVVSGIAEQYVVETLPVQTVAGGQVEAYVAGTGIRDQRLQIEVTSASAKSPFASVLKAQLMTLK